MYLKTEKYTKNNIFQSIQLLLLLIILFLQISMFTRAVNRWRKSSEAHEFKSSKFKHDW